MAEFRRGLIAFAVVALLLVLGSTAYAQNCIANQGNPFTDRAEGVTELVGDIFVTCTGGNPTAAGVPIPLYTISILLNTNVTSRLMSGTTATGGVSEAVLAIDDPGTATTEPTGAAGVTYPAVTVNQVTGVGLLGCVAVNSTNCAILGNGGGFGANGPYTGVQGHPNLFQGTWNPALPQAITWAGVPIDAPGSTVRIIRITNVRANACQLGVSSTLIPAQITALITITGSQAITLQNPQPAVAVILPGLTTGVTKALTFQQCVTLNNLIVNPSASGPPVGIGLGGSNPSTQINIGITATEGAGNTAAFKPRNFSQYSGTVTVPVASGTAPSLQQLLGFAYNAESGFVTNAASNAASIPAFGAVGAVTGAIGEADTGTELQYGFASVPAGVIIAAPSTIYLYPTSVTSTAAAAAAVVGTAAAALAAGATGVATLVSGASGGQVTLSGGAGSLTYEVLLSSPTTQEFAFLPATPAFVSNTATNLPGITTTGATVVVNFAPLSTVPTAAPASTAAIPRFCQTHTPATAFNINACSCDLLFPFVTNQAGFDTGVAIANTSLDPFKTPTQSGNVTLNYYGNTTGGGAAPAAATTTSVVAAGAELVFTLSGGGTNGIAATPGFQGYIIAVAAFQYCHGFAFITDGIGTSSGIAEGYLAIQLDEPTWASIIGAGTRTGNIGESQGQ